MRRAVAGLLTMGVAASLSGCLGGRLPPLEYYRVATADSARLATPLSGSPLQLTLAPGAVAIAPYQTPGIYADRGIVYRIGDTQYGSYPSREWALPLSTMLALLTQDVLAARPLTAQPAVFSPSTYAGETYVWRGFVRQFEEVDRGAEVHAAVALDARVVRVSDDSIVWSGSVRFEEPVPQGTMPAVVSTLSRVATEAVGQLADEARASLARAASAGRVPR